jgi:hypothetical protein
LTVFLVGAAQIASHRRHNGETKPPISGLSVLLENLPAHQRRLAAGAETAGMTIKFRTPVASLDCQPARRNPAPSKKKATPVARDGLMHQMFVVSD